MKIVLALMLSCLLVACSATMGGNQPSFNDSAGLTVAAVTEVRTATTALLKANKISVADAENVQHQADSVVDAIAVARLLHTSKPADGDAKLNAAKSVLKTLTDYLAKKGG